MTSIQIFKRLYKDYTKKYLKQIFLAIFFSLLVAGSTSAIAWLLDPAIDKIFIQKDQSLLILIPILIILAFTTKGVSLYLAKVMMINVAEEIKIVAIDKWNNRAEKTIKVTIDLQSTDIAKVYEDLNPNNVKVKTDKNKRSRPIEVSTTYGTKLSPDF